MVNEFKLEILKAVYYDIDKAKECYNFVSEEQPTAQAEATTVRPQGIYLIYEDHAEPYTGSNDAKGVKYIGVAFQGKSFAVALKDAGEEVVLLPESKKAADRLRFPRECDAIYDYDSYENTTALCDDNPGLRDLLKEGEAIPALGILNIMAHYKDLLNEALAYVGGEEIKAEWYWSSTEYSQNNAWSVYFINRSTFNNKYYGFAVRAVAAF